MIVPEFKVVPVPPVTDTVGVPLVIVKVPLFENSVPDVPVNVIVEEALVASNVPPVPVTKSPVEKS